MSEFEVVTVAGKDALAELARLRSRFAATGLYPILLGEAEDYERLLEGMEEGFDFSAILRESESIDPAAWFRSKLGEEPELYQDDEGEWPEETPEEMGIVTHLDVLSHEPLKEVLIALLEVASPWEAFARLHWGGWNDCPSPAEHCALHRYWASRYGAEVVSITGDVVQCAVSRPPADRDASLRLAREQYIYCFDIVEQGVGTIAALGAGLLDAPYWYFWWD